jgi:hypothetical protein
MGRNSEHDWERERRLERDFERERRPWKPRPLVETGTVKEQFQPSTIGGDK